MLSYNTPEREISIPIFLTHPPLKHHSDIFHRRGGFHETDMRRKALALAAILAGVALLSLFSS